jgi:hypothetical protein
MLWSTTSAVCFSLPISFCEKMIEKNKSVQSCREEPILNEIRKGSHFFSLRNQDGSNHPFTYDVKNQSAWSVPLKKIPNCPLRHWDSSSPYPTRTHQYISSGQNSFVPITMGQNCFVPGFVPGTKITPSVLSRGQKSPLFFGGPPPYSNNAFMI